MSSCNGKTDCLEFNGQQTSVEDLFYQLVQRDGLDGVEVMLDGVDPVGVFEPLQPTNYEDADFHTVVNFEKLVCSSNQANIDAPRQIVFYLKLLEGSRISANLVKILLRFEPSKLDNFFNSLCQLKIEGGSDVRKNFYELIFNKSIFIEIALNKKSRDRLFGVVKTMGVDFKYVAEDLPFMIESIVESKDNNAGEAITSLCKIINDNYSVIMDLFDSNFDAEKKESLVSYIFYNYLTNEQCKAKDVVNKLKKMSFGRSDIVDILVESIKLNYDKDIFELVDMALSTIDALNIEIDKNTIKHLIREVVSTKMEGVILKHGANILKLLCPDKAVRSRFAENFGGGLFQILYFLYNSWQAEVAKTNNSELTYDQAIQIWMKENNVKSRAGLFISILKLCMEIYQKHGIRYWGRYSVNSIKTILAGEINPETAFIITTKSGDDNGAFYKIYNDLELLQRRGFNLVVLEKDTKVEIFDYLEKRLERYLQTEREGNLFDLSFFASMDIYGHGYPDIIILYKDSEDQYTLNCSDEEWKRYPVLFKEGARISLASCFAGLEFLDCLGGYLSEISCSKFRGGLGAASSKLKENSKMGEIYREYDDGQSPYREFTTPCKPIEQ